MHTTHSNLNQRGKCMETTEEGGGIRGIQWYVISKHSSIQAAQQWGVERDEKNTASIIIQHLISSEHHKHLPRLAWNNSKHSSKDPRHAASLRAGQTGTCNCALTTTSPPSKPTWGFWGDWEICNIVYGCVSCVWAVAMVLKHYTAHMLSTVLYSVL